MSTVRPSMAAVMVEFLLTLRQRSTCERTQQACIITDVQYQRVLAIGYNGKARGEEHRCDSVQPGKCGCVHAEMNAVAKLQSNELLIGFITQSPCALCARLLVNVGRFSAIYYLKPYRDLEGIKILNGAGLTCKEWSIA